MSPEKCGTIKKLWAYASYYQGRTRFKLTFENISYKSIIQSLYGGKYRCSIDCKNFILFPFWTCLVLQICKLINIFSNVLSISNDQI